MGSIEWLNTEPRVGLAIAGAGYLGLFAAKTSRGAWLARIRIDTPDIPAIQGLVEFLQHFESVDVPEHPTQFFRCTHTRGWDPVPRQGPPRSLTITSERMDSSSPWEDGGVSYGAESPAGAPLCATLALGDDKWACYRSVPEFVPKKPKPLVRMDVNPQIGTPSQLHRLPLLRIGQGQQPYRGDPV